MSNILKSWVTEDGLRAMVLKHKGNFVSGYVECPECLEDSDYYEDRFTKLNVAEDVTFLGWVGNGEEMIYSFGFDTNFKDVTQAEIVESVIEDCVNLSEGLTRIKEEVNNNRYNTELGAIGEQGSKLLLRRFVTWVEKRNGNSVEDAEVLVREGRVMFVVSGILWDFNYNQESSLLCTLKDETINLEDILNLDEVLKTYK